MVYDPRKGRGIRKKHLPEPNPTKVELSRRSTIFEVFNKAIELYYKGLSEVTVNDVSLADSTGKEIAVENLSHWRLWNDYSQNGFVPSRHKLYTMVDVSNKVTLHSIYFVIVIRNYPYYRHLMMILPNHLKGIVTIVMIM